MAKKLKVPKGGLKTEQQESPPAENTVAEQAAELVESGEVATGEPEGSVGEGGDLESQMDAAYAAADSPPQAEAEQPAESLPESPPAAAAAPSEKAVEQTVEQVDQLFERRKAAYSEALLKHQKDRYQWEIDTAAAKERHTVSAIAKSAAEDAYKAAKAKEKDLLEELVELLRDEPREPRWEDFASMTFHDLNPTPDQPAAATEPIASDAWQSVPITKLDIPEKLIERLQEDGIDTIGRLEARRAEISEGKAKWPKGIGEQKITKTENAVIDWLTKNRDQAAFSELQSGHASEQPAAEAPAVPADAAAPTEETPPPATPIVNDEAYADAINARAIELDTGESNCLADQMGIGHWQAGYDHYKAGGELRACELRPSLAQDDFIRGWLAAGKVEDWPDVTETVESEPPAGEGPELEPVGAGASGPQLFDPNDI